MGHALASITMLRKPVHDLSGALKVSISFTAKPVMALSQFKHTGLPGQRNGRY